MDLRLSTSKVELRVSGQGSLQKLWFKVAVMQGNKEFLEAEHVSVLAANQDLQVDITKSSVPRITTHCLVSTVVRFSLNVYVICSNLPRCCASRSTRCYVMK